MSTRPLLLSLCLATLTLGCFDQLKSGSEAEPPIAVSTDAPDEDCDEEAIEALYEACEEGEEEACEEFRELLAECEDEDDDDGDDWDDDDWDERCEELEEYYEEGLAEYGECVLTRGEENCEELEEELSATQEIQEE